MLRLLRAIRTAGATAPLRVLLRLPVPVRRIIARPLAGATEPVARRGRTTRLAPVLALSARLAAAGPTSASDALARTLGLDPHRPLAVRRRIADIASVGRLNAAAEAIVETIPGDRSPALEAVRVRVALEAGRWTEALAHARAAAPARRPPTRLSEAQARGQLEVHRAGWLPDPGDAGPRLVAARGMGVRGRVLHLVSSSRPYSHAGYNVRTADVVACQRAAGLDPYVGVRGGFPASATAAGEARRRDVDGTPTWWYGTSGASVPLEAAQAEAVRNAVAVVEWARPAVLQPASNVLQAQVALALARPTGLPVVYEVRGFWEESWLARAEDEAAAATTDRYRLTREAETWAMRQADAVVTLSEVMRAEIVTRGVDEAKVVVVPNAVEVERFEPPDRDDALAARLGIGRDDPVVGYVSSLNPFEGLPGLLEAVARLRPQVPDVKVLLVGDGEEQGTIRATAARLGLDDGTLVMPGRVPHDQVIRYYSLIDVFVVPRTNHRVSRLVTPLKPYEAMALEKAVVVSDLPALREVVDPGRTGLTFRPEDPEDLAAVLGRLIEDPSLRRELGRNAREWIVAERTWAANGVRYRELFERLGVG